MWDCMRRDSSRSHHEFACATSNMTGKSMKWLRQVATNYGIPMESQLPVMNFADFGQRMPFAEESLDFIYSQHALNKLPSPPRTHFAPFMSEIARLLRPNGTALLQNSMLTAPDACPQVRRQGGHSGSDSYKFEIIDDRLGCEAAGFERYTIASSKWLVGCHALFAGAKAEPGHSQSRQKHHRPVAQLLGDGVCQAWRWRRWR